MEPTREQKDYYAILGVSPLADQETIGRAYRRLIKAVHPDSHRGRPVPEVGRRVTELVEAWRVLSDPAKRVAYDLSRRARQPQSPPGKEGRAVRRRPSLAINPAVLDLGVVPWGETATGKVRLENRDGRASAVERSESIPDWISISRAGPPGSRLSFPVDMAVRVDTTRLSPRRRHRAEVSFRLANPAEGSRSLEEKLVVTLAVAPPQAPRFEVRPGEWLVKSCECHGAPRSLVLRLFLGNRGGGELSGTLQGEPWMRVSPQQFGSLRRGSETHVSVEVDCQAWEAAGWRDGVLRVATANGDLREVLVVSPRRQGQGKAAGACREEWCPGAAVVAAIGPGLALLAGLPAFALVLALLGSLALPAVLATTRRREALSGRLRDRAEGWELGPADGGARLWLSSLAWALLGGLLGTGVGGDLLPAVRPAAPWGGALAAAVAGLSVSVRDELPLGVAPREDVSRWLYLSFLALATGTAWAVVGTLAAESLLGALMEEAPLYGAAAGWAMGSLVSSGRNQDLAGRWRGGVRKMLWRGLPLVSGALGFAASLQTVVHWRVTASNGPTGLLFGTTGASSLLLALPGESLAASLVGIATCLGLLAGFGLGLIGLLPVIGWAAAGGASGGTLSAGRLVGNLVMNLVERHADMGEGSWDPEEEPETLRGYLLRIPWPTLLVGVAASLLLVYSAAHLLLALVATLGILVG